MKSPSQILFDVLKALPRTDCKNLQTFFCWVCGSPWHRGIDRNRWMGANFVGQNRVRSWDSLFVCEPCVVVMAGRPPDTMRMYTHLWDSDGYHKYNKGNKAEIRAWLWKPHPSEWFASIADSGQKHVIPWTPINPLGRCSPLVLFEEQTIPLGDWSLISDLSDLLTLGSTKEGLSRGEYGKALLVDKDKVRSFEDTYRALRGGAWFGFALWLAQRDEVVVAARLEEEKRERSRQKKADRPNCRRRSGAPNGVSENSHPQRDPALDLDPGTTSSGHADTIESSRMGHLSGPSTPT